jgi:hypothetical protein
MKSFTAKQFSRTPGVVFDAAREDGKVEITHGQFAGKFQLYYMAQNVCELEVNDTVRINGQQFRVVPWNNGDKS